MLLLLVGTSRFNRWLHQIKQIIKGFPGVHRNFRVMKPHSDCDGSNKHGSPTSELGNNSFGGDVLATNPTQDVQALCCLFGGYYYFKTKTVGVSYPLLLPI